jgi:hypothetical protein
VAPKLLETLAISRTAAMASRLEERLVGHEPSA